MNSFGQIFRISVFGESHGESIGALIDGCPPSLPIAGTDFSLDMARRKPGSVGTTSRVESDEVKIISGVYNGYSTGSPVLLLISNSDAIPADYERIKNLPRPGHSDFVSNAKYRGYADLRGGGHFSGRITAAIVAAGVIAKKVIPDVQIKADLISAGGSSNIQDAVIQALQDGDSVGGIVECRLDNLPVGLGEPFFNSVESLISHIIFAIPAIKGIEFGSGFKAAEMRGSVHNDEILDINGNTATNNSGGINGGITNGNQAVFRVAVKPASSIAKAQHTIDLSTGVKADIRIKGRHDACIALRMPVIIEAAVACVFADLTLLAKAL